jgi:hypothetical protein
MHPALKALITSQENILEPETIRQFEPGMSEEDVNKILALATLYKSRVFFEDYNSFEDITQALNGLVPTPNVLQGCSPEQIWYALDMAHKLYPDREYSLEVLKYIEFIFNESGVFIYPSYLPIDNPYFDKAVELATNGPFPLGETTEEIQAAKYLAIQAYLTQKKD